MVQNLGLFNVNDGVGGTSDEVGTGNTPAGPFRASMTIAGLSFTTSNLLPDFCANNSPPGLIENGTDLVAGTFALLCRRRFQLTRWLFRSTNVFLNDEPPTFGTVTPGVDDGTRNIELGWSGDGAITDPGIFGPADTRERRIVRTQSTSLSRIPPISPSRCEYSR